MRKIILALAMVALAATAVFAAYSNFGGVSETAATTPITVSWTGASANWITVVPESADVTLVLNPNRDDDGVPVTIKVGTSTTMYADYFYGFTVTRATSTACDVYWGVR